VEITPISKGAAVTGAGEKPAPAEEARLPRGRESSTVQPYPMPLSTPQTQENVVNDDNAKRLHVAQMRGELSGTGCLVDTIA
jgi:hypothetical protein